MAEKAIRSKYISDGLVFQLDGINIGNKSGYWVDLVGGIEFAIGANVVRGTNHFEFVGGTTGITSNYFCIANTSLASTIPVSFDQFTFEMVIEFSRSGTHYIFRGGTNNKISLAWNSGAVTPSTVVQPRIGYPATLNQIATMSWTSNNGGYRNKRFYVNGSNDYWNPYAQFAQIGGQLNLTNGRNFSGKLYAIRLYTRQLSNEEILWNQNIDIERFSIL